MNVASEAATMFRCEPYQTTLTRAACGRRYRLANGSAGGASLDATSRIQITTSRCVACPVGEAHARGESGAPTAAAPAPAIGAEDLVRPKRRSKREVLLDRDQFTAPLRLVEPAPASDDGAPMSARGGAMATKTCERCGKGYEATGNRQKYCSAECKRATGGGASMPPRSTPPKSARRPLREEVRAAAAAIAPAALLRSLGWAVDELGRGPNGGELLVVRSGE